MTHTVIFFWFYFSLLSVSLSLSLSLSLLSQCEQCGDNMKQDPNTCACSCQDDGYTCDHPDQVLVETASADKCVCACPPSLVKFVQDNNEKFVLETSTCAKQCNTESKCEHDSMERVFDSECSCVCSESSRKMCQNSGGQYDDKTCSCKTCKAPVNKKFQLVPGTTVVEGCLLQCVPDKKCSAPNAHLDPLTCKCLCSVEATEKCTTEGKGAPVSPTCDTCGKCTNAPTCKERETFDQTTCKCLCMDARTLDCPEGNIGVSSPSKQCSCLCKKPKEKFLEIVDPSKSCTATCGSTASCVAQLSGTITQPTLQSKCECSCNSNMCAALPTSKSIWVDEHDKSQGCKCVCPTEPETCEDGERWDASSCTCVCDPNSCTCGILKQKWTGYCKDVGMVYLAKSWGDVLNDCMNTAGTSVHKQNKCQQASTQKQAVCSCGCTQEMQDVCSTFPGDVVAAVSVDPQDGALSCSCKCRNADEKCTCPDDGASTCKAVRANFEGFLPGSAHESFHPKSPLVAHLEVKPAACECACPQRTHTDLWAAHQTSVHSIMVAGDCTCTQTKCHMDSMTLTNNLHFYNNDPRVCDIQCIAAPCPEGKTRSGFPHCTCECPASSPSCGLNHFLASDCKSCQCREKCQFTSMTQNKDTCLCRCLPKWCPSGSSMQLTDQGCQCMVSLHCPLPATNMSLKRTMTMSLTFPFFLFSFFLFFLSLSVINQLNASPCQTWYLTMTHALVSAILVFLCFRLKVGTVSTSFRHGRGVRIGVTKRPTKENNAFLTKSLTVIPVTRMSVSVNAIPT
jgi:hypothetical protein